MLDELERLVDDVASLNSKLVLLIGPPRSGKSALLGKISVRRCSPVVRVGAALGQRLLTIPSTQRHLSAAELMKELTDEAAKHGLLVLDNLELLFDRTLQLNPLEVLKRHAHPRCVLAAWPGELRDGRLSYASAGHPEHQDYGVEGVVPFKIQ